MPCGHPGCLSHVSHPCEGCGRLGGRNVVRLAVRLHDDWVDISQDIVSPGSTDVSEILLGDDRSEMDMFGTMGSYLENDRGKVWVGAVVCESYAHMQITFGRAMSFLSPEYRAIRHRREIWNREGQMFIKFLYCGEMEKLYGLRIDGYQNLCSTSMPGYQQIEDFLQSRMNPND